MRRSGRGRSPGKGGETAELLLERRLSQQPDEAEELRLQPGGWATLKRQEKRPPQFQLYGVFARVFLPVGYPSSVRLEYLEYQSWDSLQGLSSYLRSVLCARSILAGAGVGSASITPLAAAFAWTARDGVAIVGSLFFAYHFSDLFECNLKEWRLFADVLNNVGLTLDLFTGLLPTRYFLIISGLSSLSKSLCGLVAGATKARISQHFARAGSLGDVIAKEATQETAVNLLGLVLGVILSQLVGSDDYSNCALFFGLLVLHQFANYRLVSVLVLDTLSGQRLLIITQALVLGKAGAPPTPLQVSASERLWRPLHLWQRGPRVGASARHISLNGISWSQLQACWGKLVVLCLFGLDHRGRVVVCLKEGVTELDNLRAHLVGYFLFLSLERQGSSRGLPGRYRILMETIAPALAAWASMHVLVSDDALRESFSASGWDIGAGKTRLGEGEHRVALVKEQ